MFVVGANLKARQEASKWTEETAGISLSWRYHPGAFKFVWTGWAYQKCFNYGDIAPDANALQYILFQLLGTSTKDKIPSIKKSCLVSAHGYMARKALCWFQRLNRDPRKTPLLVQTQEKTIPVFFAGVQAKTMKGHHLWWKNTLFFWFFFFFFLVWALCGNILWCTPCSCAAGWRCSKTSNDCDLLLTMVGGIGFENGDLPKTSWWWCFHAAPDNDEFYSSISGELRQLCVQYCLFGLRRWLNPNPNRLFCFPGENVYTGWWLSLMFCSTVNTLCVCDWNKK